MRRQNFYWLIVVTLLGVLLTACGNDKPTATSVPPPPATPAPPPPAAYLAQVDFDFADQAEQAQRTFVTSRPDFPAYASWTQSSHWYILARDSSDARLRDRAGKTARIFPVSYFGEALNEGTSAVFPAYMMILNRATVDVKANGAQEATKLLFNRAVEIGIKAGLLLFTVGDDQIYLLAASSYPADRVMALASLGKLEMVGAGTKPLTDGAVVATSASPTLGDLKIQNSTVYSTVAENSDFASFGVGSRSGTGQLNFEMRPGSKLFDYSRANIGKYTALVFDRQVVASAQFTTPVKERGQIQVNRFTGRNGQADLQRFVDLLNANPRQLFEAKELNRSPNFVYSGSFTR